MQSTPAKSANKHPASGKDRHEGVVAPVAGFISVPVDVIRGDEALKFTLYRKDADANLTPLCQAGETLTDTHRRQLAERHTEIVYVETAEHPAYRLRAEGGIASLLGDSELGERRYRLAYELACQLTDEILEQPLAEQIDRAAILAKGVAQACLADMGAANHMLLCQPKHYQTPAHMVNVCLLGLKLAEGLMIEPFGWPTLALGMLLHDVGKMGVPESVLMKEGRLSDAEWQFVFSHPVRGYEWLSQFEALPAVVGQIAQQHHEYLDGNGFPLRRRSETIVPWAKLCAIVDQYDLQISGRPRRQAISRFEVLAAMGLEAGRWFDAEMLKSWRAVIERETAPRRADPRFSFPVSCRVGYLSGCEADHNVSFWASAVDVSRSGLRFLHHQPLRMGERVTIFIPAANHLPSKNLVAAVVRCSRGQDNLYHIGVRFAGMETQAGQS